MVGSIEPRKSHEYVLNAFESLWAAEINVSLVFVGRNTWKSDALLERISSHQRLNQNLFLLRDATDVDLDFCYNHSSALIIASTVEGFGLPIVEAFQAGLPVIASDIPVFREIAKDNATYFLLDNTESLAGEYATHSGTLLTRRHREESARLRARSVVCDVVPSRVSALISA